MHEFLVAWNHILDDMGRHVIPDENLRDVFCRKIKDEPALQYDVNEYERMFESDPKKSYTYLRLCVEMAIRMQEQKKNLADREALLTAKIGQVW